MCKTNQKSIILLTYDCPLSDVTYVGIHNRRTDFLKYIKEAENVDPLEKSYFYDGMDYFRYNYSSYDIFPEQ
jgi:hypothetical protein